MTNFIENNFIISMHYRNGVVTCSFNEVEGLFKVHTSTIVINDFQDSLLFYKAYVKFIEKNNYSLIVSYVAKYWGVSIEGKTMKNVMKEVTEIQHNILKEME